MLDYAAIRTRKDRARVRVNLMSMLIRGLRDNKVNVIVLNDVPPGHGLHVITEDVGFTRAIVGLTIRDLTGRTSDHPYITFSGR